MALAHPPPLVGAGWGGGSRGPRRLSHAPLLHCRVGRRAPFLIVPPQREGDALGRSSRKLKSGHLVIRHTDEAAHNFCPTSLLRNCGSSYSEEPRMEILQHGEDRLRIEPVPGRLRRPPGIAATWSRAISSLYRVGARPDRQCVRSPGVRANALLGRRPSRVGRGATRLRGGVAEPTEVGRVALVEVSRAQRHTCRG